MKTDIEIIDDILDGKKDNFSLLMEKYHNEIFKYVYNILGSYESTEDLLQEIFLKVYNNLIKYNSEKASFRTWLYRISTNQTLNYIKSKGYKNNYMNSTYEETTIRSSSDVEEDLVKEEEINQVKSIIEKLLSPKHQKIMFLHYFSGLSVKEIGESTDIPEKTIYKAIKTSIVKIK